MITTDIAQCEKLWRTYSPDQTLWESWDVAYAYVSAEKITPYFIYNESGLLPLQKEGEKFYLFGHEYLENYTFWFAPEKFVAFFSEIPPNTRLYNLHKESVDAILQLFPELSKFFFLDDFHYFIDLAAINYDISTFFSRFAPKHRKNFLYDLRKVAHFDMTWTQEGDFSEIVRLNILRLGTESDYHCPIFQAQVEALVRVLLKLNELHYVTITDGEKIIGVEFGALHNNVWYVINGGSDPEYKNIGKRLLYEHMRKAMEHRCDKIDFLSGTAGSWKEQWNLDSCPLMTFSNVEKEEK